MASAVDSACLHGSGDPGHVLPSRAPCPLAAIEGGKSVLSLGLRVGEPLLIVPIALRERFDSGGEHIFDGREATRCDLSLRITCDVLWKIGRIKTACHEPRIQ